MNRRPSNTIGSKTRSYVIRSKFNGSSQACLRGDSVFVHINCKSSGNSCGEAADREASYRHIGQSFASAMRENTADANNANVKESKRIRRDMERVGKRNYSRVSINH